MPVPQKKQPALAPKPAPKPAPKGAPMPMVKSKPQFPGPKQQPAPGAGAGAGAGGGSGEVSPIRAAPPKPLKATPPVKQQPVAPAAPAVAPTAAATEAVPTSRREEVPVAETASPANWPGSLPAFDVFCKELDEVFDGSLRKSIGGAASASLPAATCSAGYAVCTMDGHVHTHGAESGTFSLQGAVWALLFSMCAPAKAAEYIGKEHVPSSDAASAVHARAPNPLTRAGGLVLSALSLAEAPGGESWERLDAVVAAASALAGSPVGYSMSAYAKARKGSENAWANAYALRGAGNLPGNAGVAEVADFFFQVNALQMTAAQAATFAAAVANDGVSPKTGVKTEGCFAQTISMTSSMGVARDCQQKLPSVGGESGVVLVFIPHVCGIAVFSKEVDAGGLSLAGSEFVRQIAAKYKFK